MEQSYSPGQYTKAPSRSFLSTDPVPPELEAAQSEYDAQRLAKIRDTIDSSVSRTKMSLEEIAKNDVSLSDLVYPKMSMRDVAAANYGSEENFDKELEKARYYRNYQKGYTGEDPNADLFQDPKALTRRIPVTTNNRQYPHYDPETSIVNVNTPDEVKKDATEELAKLDSGNPEEAADAEKFLKQNSMTRQSLVSKISQPLKSFVDTLMHELGHHSAYSKDEQMDGWDRSHEATGPEFANSLGKIQRQEYEMTGERFTSPEQFDRYMEQESNKPEADRFRGFSEDAKRGLRFLMRSYENEQYAKKHGVRGRGDQAPIRKAAKAIPGFVLAKNSEGTVV